MHKFFVPIDGSDEAHCALEYALRLAKEGSSIELHIVTVHQEPSVYGQTQIYVTDTQMGQLQLQHSHDILAPALEAAKKAGIEHTSEILIGNTAPMIVKRAEELGCDGIIMGTQGRGTLGSLFMGSVAVKVVHLNKLPARRLAPIHDLLKRLGPMAVAILLLAAGFRMPGATPQSKI